MISLLRIWKAKNCLVYSNAHLRLQVASWIYVLCVVIASLYIIPQCANSAIAILALPVTSVLKFVNLTSSVIVCESIAVDFWRSVLWKTPMTRIWQKMLAKGDIGHIWDKRSNGTYHFVYLVSFVLKVLWTGGWLIKGVCGPGALRLGANNGSGRGRALGIAGFILCCWLVELGGVLGLNWTFTKGAGLFVVVKGERAAFGVRETKLFCCRAHIRSAELFSGRLDVSVLLDCGFWICAPGKISDKPFDLITVQTALVKNAVEWVVKNPGTCAEGGWLSAIPWLVMLRNTMPCWPVSFSWVCRCVWYKEFSLAAAKKFQKGYSKGRVAAS